MKILAGRPIRLLALVPHRDSARLLRSACSLHFARGLLGSRCLPIFAPLAALRRPLSRSELISIAAGLRKTTLSCGKRGKIACGDQKRLEYPGFADILGLALDLPDPASFGGTMEKAIDWFPQAALCMAILRENETFEPIPLPRVDFKHAFLANMVVRFFDQGMSPYSIDWEIGRGVWLPPCAERA